ncbi:MAG: DEAD/DEAH box helicase [Candidatus Colwellbacteria bacterium]|nr:DEAD/DEAH box helicase [Candidatus Colwellbacteria bacterium]
MPHEQPEVFKPTIRPKTTEELKEQLTRASRLVGAGIAPPLSEDFGAERSFDELKRRYPKRYEIYLRALRALKNKREIAAGGKNREWRELLVSNLDEYIERHWQNGENGTLRRHQITAFTKLRDFLKKGGEKGYIKLPTGTGKTVLFAELVEAIGAKTLVLVPGIELIGQTLRQFEKFAERTNLGVYYAGEKSFGEDGVIMTMQSFVALMKRGEGEFKPSEYRLVIVDEAHRMLTELREKALEPFGSAIQIGFTATPILAEEKAVEELYPTRIYGMEVEEAVRTRLLAPVTARVVRTETDISGVSLNLQEFRIEELDRAVDNEGRNRLAVDLYTQRYSGRRALVFCTTIRHAKKLAALFVAANVRASSISSENSKKDREGILQKFREGEIDVLCNVDVLTEGFDDPGVSVCLNLRPTFSPRLAEQRGGRTLRLDPDDPEKHAVIVDFVDTYNKDPKPVLFADILLRRAASKAGGRVGAREGGGEAPRDKKSLNARVTGQEEDLVSIIPDEAPPEATEKAPHGWLTIYGLTVGAFAKNRYHGVYVVAQSFRASHPEWFHFYLDSKHRTREYLAPELCLKVIEQVSSETLVPAGWMTFDGFRKGERFTVTMRGKRTERCGRAKTLIREILKERPEWAGNFLDDQGRLYQHFSPELIAHVEARLAGEKEPPKGWVSVKSLAGEYERNVLEKVDKMARQYRKSHPEDFGIFVAMQGALGWHVSPEFANRIRKRLDSDGYVRRIRTADQAREEGKALRRGGWLTLTEIQERLRLSRIKTRQLLSEAIREFPEDVRFLPSENKQARRLYSRRIVELVSGMTEEAKQELEGQGWLKPEQIIELFTETPLAVNGKGAKPKKAEGRERVREIVREVVGQFRTVRPNLVRYTGFGVEYYDPELIDMIWRRLLKASREEPTIILRDDSALPEAAKRRLAVILGRGKRTVKWWEGK